MPVCNVLSDVLQQPQHTPQSPSRPSLSSLSPPIASNRHDHPPPASTSFSLSSVVFHHAEYLPSIHCSNTTTYSHSHSYSHSPHQQWHTRPRQTSSAAGFRHLLVCRRRRPSSAMLPRRQLVSPCRRRPLPPVVVFLLVALSLTVTLLPSTALSLPMATAFELSHLKLSSTASVPSPVAASSSGSPTTLPSRSSASSPPSHLSTSSSSGSLNGSQSGRLQSRQVRASQSAAPPVVAPQLPYRLSARDLSLLSPFTILAILPEESAPEISMELRGAQSRWEQSGHASAFATERSSSSSRSSSRSSFSSKLPSISAKDIPLVVYSEPANNDTERLLSSVCEWISIHKPDLVLSLLDRERHFYASLVAEAAGIPFVSLTQTYRNEINSLGDDHQLEIDFKQATESLFDPIPPPPSPEEEPVFSQFHSPDASSLRLSLDPPIQTLADATFELLRAQYWFDAILLIDDSTVSDLFARRLSALCRNGNGGNGGHTSHPGGSSSGSGRYRRRLNGEQGEPFDVETRRKLDSSLYGDDWAWSNFKRSSLKKAQHRINALNTEEEGVEGHRRRSAPTYDDFYDERKSKEASLLDVWKNLIVIRLSRSLNQTEFYLRMAEIQTTHRRVVLVHSDWDTTQRVIGTARELDLFNGDNIWIMLDGLLDLEHATTIFHPQTPEAGPSEGDRWGQVDLPTGMLALRHRHRSISDSNLLGAIVELAGKAALNAARNSLLTRRRLQAEAQLKPSKHRSPPFTHSHSALHPSSSSTSPFLSSSSAPLSPFSSSSQLSACSTANSTHAQREHRLNILRELRNLVEPVLSRYRWNRRKPCSALRSSAKAAAAARKPRQRQGGGGGGRAPNYGSQLDSGAETNQNQNQEEQPVRGHSSSAQAELDASREADELETRIGASDLYRWIVPEFEILNLVPTQKWRRGEAGEKEEEEKDRRGGNEWRPVGNISVDQSVVNTILYIGADQMPDYIAYDGPDEPFASNARPQMYMTNSGKHRFRVATNIAPPFVIEATKLDNNTCLTGDFCLKVETSRRNEIIAIFTDFRSNRRLYEGKKYQVACCAGIAIDLLNAVARDLHFDYDLYLVADGLFGVNKDGNWDGVVSDLVNDVAHLSFTAFSTTSSRVSQIDFSVPFFYSGVSCLSMTSNETDVPLLAFLIPFSYELWAAIFASLFVTAVATAIYEWFSPFGLNPWGRQRTKNFSLASALWVMCSLLFSHLVAFKAPKSWPNKVLINVWGAFSVIFLATYTANIAAHFAGLFLVPEVNDFHDTSLMKQRTGTARSSASEGYLMEKYQDLWKYIRRYKVDSFDEGLEHLRAGKLDVLIGDTAILDYYRATDPGCQLRLLGDSIFDDAYAVGMQKGFPFRDSISNLILKYNEYGFLDQLHRKWYGRVHCLESSSLTKPMPLTVKAEAGVFLMLLIGIGVGVLILFAEHFVFKYMLPGLRKKPKDCFWKSPNLMFFSQKLYRFINTVELVSPHHSAKEIISNLKEGQIASLFQKSVKRKAKEEARRRKSKSQFFELMQEARKIVRQKKEGSLQEDEDEMEDGEGVDDIDEEVALNTDANVRATRPSFSTVSQGNSLLDSDSDGRVANRVPAIRFKDPEIIDEKKRKKKKRTTPPPPHTESETRKLVSKLKKNSLPDSKRRMLDISSSYSFETDDSARPSEPDTAARDRRANLRASHLNSTSLSLENICYEGVFSEGISRKREGAKLTRRTCSFEDLPAIKKELSESSNESGGNGADEGFGYDEEANSRISPPKMYANETTPTAAASSYGAKLSNGQQYRMSKSTTTPGGLSTGQATVALPRSSLSATQLMDRMSATNLNRFSHTDLLNMWRSSEREMLKELDSVLEQKRALEQKVALLQRMMKKPP